VLGLGKLLNSERCKGSLVALLLFGFDFFSSSTSWAYLARAWPANHPEDPCGIAAGLPVAVGDMFKDPAKKGPVRCWQHRTVSRDSDSFRVA
jgi:hypothetical protein